jgi:NAD(P)-dependent dehydrogenase (short-subunit alcohol dehydrogenase family)
MANQNAGRLTGKMALITGAGRGIGRGIARAMAKEGADIAVVELDTQTAAEAAKEIEGLGRRSVSIPCDVSTRDACEDAMARTIDGLGGLDILVNNAAINPQIAPITEVRDDAFEQTLNVCTMATFWFMQAAYPHLVARGGGSIINFGSGAGTSGLAHQMAYAAAKEAVRAMTRVAANEWGRDGITVNAICPLAKSEGMQAWAESDARGFDRFVQTIPLKRAGDCEEDIGRTAVFLASEDARYMTANTLWVDGGSGVTR